ncbi:hypothetical protein P879_00446 [Paragonimus westermani]|uniref:Uncharacterized protein n=1 Tax=Paragonimus westermani TaxID=34504 RepID=A0A8T0DWW3_9TREM|nr:hypothetical protein P879_00446 [Paragonimus westermani]
MLSASQKGLKPDSPKLIANESRTYQLDDSEKLDMECLLMPSSSSQTYLPTGHSNRIARYLLDPDMQLSQNYSTLKTTEVIAPQVAPDRLHSVSSTPMNSLPLRSDLHAAFSQQQYVSECLPKQNERAPPTESSRSITCDSHNERRSRFSERIQLARIAVDERAKMNKKPSHFDTHYLTNVVCNTPPDETFNKSTLCPATLRCLLRDETCADAKHPLKPPFIKPGSNELTQNQHRHVDYQPEYLDKKQNTEYTSVQVSPRTTKLHFQDPVDSSGLDVDSPSEVDTSFHSDDASVDNMQNMSATYDSLRTEKQEARFKIVQPKGVLVSESPDARRQRKLEKNNGSQRTVVWMDELYGDSSSGCCTRKCDSLTELNQPNSMRRKTHPQCPSTLHQNSPSGILCTNQQTDVEHCSMFNGIWDKFSDNQRCTSITTNPQQKTPTTPSGRRSLPDPSKAKRFSMS